jgi:hypothetical protein
MQQIAIKFVINPQHVSSVFTPIVRSRTAFHCLWFSVLFIVFVMLESRVVRCVHCDEDVALKAAYAPNKIQHSTEY